LCLFELYRGDHLHGLHGLPDQRLCRPCRWLRWPRACWWITYITYALSLQGRQHYRCAFLAAWHEAVGFRGGQSMPEHPAVLPPLLSPIHLGVLATDAGDFCVGRHFIFLLERHGLLRTLFRYRAARLAAVRPSNCARPRICPAELRCSWRRPVGASH
jgi:hypothetical protein